MAFSKTERQHSQSCDVYATSLAAARLSDTSFFCKRLGTTGCLPPLCRTISTKVRCTSLNNVSISCLRRGTRRILAKRLISLFLGRSASRTTGKISISDWKYSRFSGFVLLTAFSKAERQLSQSCNVYSSSARGICFFNLCAPLRFFCGAAAGCRTPQVSASCGTSQLLCDELAMSP